MNEVECLYVAVLLFKQVIKTYNERGYIRPDEKTQIFKTICQLTNEILRLYKFRQLGELLGEFEVPRIKDSDLKEECTETHYE